MPDLVERLRARCKPMFSNPPPYVNPDGPEAADKLEAMQAALERIQEEANTVGPDWRETASMIDSICIAALNLNRERGPDAA